MKRRDHPRPVAALQNRLAAFGDGQPPSHYRYQRFRAQRDDDLRLDRADLFLEPDIAGVELALCRCLVQAPLATRLPAEMLDGVGDIGGRRVAARIRGW